MRTLLEGNPGEFLRRSMPAADRAKLPPQIAGFVEQRIKARGAFRVYCQFPKPTAPGSNPHSGGHAAYGREAQIGETLFRAFVGGKWRDQTTVSDAVIEGVVLEDAIALADAPTPAEQVAAGEPVIAETPTASGTNTVLYMIARFSDQGSDPIDDATARSQMADVNTFWLNSSYGAVGIRGRVNPSQAIDVAHITLPRQASDASFYNANFFQLLADARSAARVLGYNYANYNLDVVITTATGFTYAGRSFVGAQGTHLVQGYTSLRTAGHELGHNLGLWHANYWRTDATKPFGKDSNPGGYVVDIVNGEWLEYGHEFSLMSAQYGPEIDDPAKPHYAPREKQFLNWLANGRESSVSASGTNRLFRLDHRNTVGNPRAIRIATPATDYTGNMRYYWLSYRYAPWTTAQDWLRNGVQVDVAQAAYGSDGAILLDMTPYSNDESGRFYNPSSPPGNFFTIDQTDKKDGALVVGRTYSDTAAGVHITPLSTGNNGANEEYIDIVINLGTFAGNRRPVIAVFSVTTNQAAPGQLVDFSVIASDPDGDVLAYAWDFDQVQSWAASGLNSHSASKSWPNAGQYRVTVTVSDMKGGIATESLTVTVAAPASNRQIWGRVLWAGQPVHAARVWATDSGGAVWSVWTGSDGSYGLTGLSSNATYTVQCMADGLAFTPQFANPVSVASANAYAKDFYANQSAPGGAPPMALVVVPYKVEVTNGGTVAFRTDAWDRSGNPISVSPTWSVAGGGIIAANGLFSAAISGGPFPVTALAGGVSATGEVWVTGPNPLPAVSLATVATMGLESSTCAGVFRLSRDGATNLDLTINLAVQGTATFGLDYLIAGADQFTSTSATVTIPAGATNRDVTVVPVDDGLLEGDEIISLVIQPGFYYKLGSSTNTTVTMQDDEAGVSISASGNGAEDGSSTGAFLVSRSGYSANALSVHLSVAGTASNGVDFAFIGDPVTLAPGAANQRIDVVCIDDAHVEGVETIEIALLPGAGYVVQPPASAVVNLLDNETPASILTHPQSRVVTLGSNALFAVLAAGSPPLFYQWFRGGTGALPWATADTLVITNVQKADAGVYWVTVSNGPSVTSSNAQLVLNHPPVPASPQLGRPPLGACKVRETSLLGTDEDADGLSLSAVSSNSAAGGSVWMSHGWVFYTPPVSQPDVDTVTYTVTDGRGGFGPGTITVVVKTNAAAGLNLVVEEQVDGKRRIVADGIPGRTYLIEYTESLETPKWQSVGSATADGLGLFLFIHDPPVGTPSGYYRVTNN